MRVVILAICIVCVLLMNASAFAQKSIQETEIYKHLVDKKPASKEVKTDFEALKTLSTAEKDSLKTAFIKMLAKHEDEMRGWSIELSGSYVGERAYRQKKSNIDASAEVTKGRYPRQFRFKMKTKVQYCDGDLSEDLMALLLNYDYYVHENVSVYAFIERFSDSYMGIEHRFENGVGMMWEGTYGIVDSKKIDKIASSTGWNLMEEEERRELEAFKKTALIHLKKKDARLKFALAGSIFYEMEHPEDVELVLDDAHPDTVNIEMDFEQMIRCVLRPSIGVKVNSNITLYGHCYFKVRAFNDGRFLDTEDHRIEALLSAKLGLTKDDYGNEKVALKAEYEYRYDNQPREYTYKHNNIEFYRCFHDTHDTFTLSLLIAY